MKKIMYLFAVSLFSLSSLAQGKPAAPTTADLLQMAADSSRTAQAKDVPISPLEKLAARQKPENWEEISWKEFQKRNKRVKEIEICSVNIDNESCRQVAQLLKSDISQAITHGQGKFDYASLLAGQKIIYIGERHNTQNTIPEVVSILESVRKVNPNARILLASEFLRWTGIDPTLEMLLLQEEKKRFMQSLGLTDSDNGMLTPEQEEDSHEMWKRRKQLSLLKKAKDDPFALYVGPTYEPVVQAADRLNMDQLSLDDVICSDRMAKVGGTVVWAEPGDRIPNLEDEWASFLSLLSVSPWGMRERNREWARRIQAVLPLYDVVVVYSGMGHIDDTYSLSLPPLVGINDYTAIFLVSWLIQSEEDMAFYEQLGDTAEQKGLSQGTKVTQLEQQREDLLPADILNEWKDYSQPFWMLSTPETEQKIHKQMQEISGPEATQEYFKRYKETFPVDVANALFVLLPLE